MSEDVHIPLKEYNHIMAQVDSLKKAVSELGTTLLCEAKTKQKHHLFNPVLDEEELAECLRKLYIGCMKSMSMPGKDKHDKVKFAAYLYYLTKVVGLKGDNFNQTRFYHFIQKKVFKDLTQNVRTFNNRVNDIKFLDKAAKTLKGFDSNPDYCYFRDLKSKFQNSDFFKSLKSLLSIFSNFL